MSGAGAIALGSVSFGPAPSYDWREDEPSLRGMYDQACVSIIRLECQKDELNAEVALLREQARILQAERDEARNKCHKLRIERAAADRAYRDVCSELESYRNDACREKCRDKAAADGGWANI